MYINCMYKPFLAWDVFHFYFAGLLPWCKARTLAKVPYSPSGIPWCLRDCVVRVGQDAFVVAWVTIWKLLAFNNELGIDIIGVIFTDCTLIPACYFKTMKPSSSVFDCLPWLPLRCHGERIHSYSSIQFEAHTDCSARQQCSAFTEVTFDHIKSWVLCICYIMPSPNTML